MLSKVVYTNLKTLVFYQILFKISVFQKTSFHFHFFTQIPLLCEEFWESSYKSSCSRSHTSLKAYRILCNHSKRKIVQECLLGVEEKLYKVLLFSWCKKSGTHLAKVVLSSGVQGVDFGCTKSRIKENLKRGYLGNGCRSRGQNQDKISCVCIIFWDLFSFL